MRNKEQQEEMLMQDEYNNTDCDSEDLSLEDFVSTYKDCNDSNTLKTEALEVIFEVKDKYKEIMKKIANIPPDLLGDLEEEIDTVKDYVFGSIDINTGKINWKAFKEKVNKVYDKSEKKIIKKIVKKVLTKEFIDKETEPRDKENSSEVGTEGFDIIKKQSGAVTINSMSRQFGYFALIKVDDIFNAGSKTFIKMIEQKFTILPYSEKVFGAYVGTLGKINDNIQVHIIKREEQKIGREYYNFSFEEASECKVELLEQDQIIRVSDILKAASSKKDFARVYRDLKEQGIEELNIPIIDISHNLSVEFSVNLTESNESLMKGTEQLDKIFNKEGVVSIREIYKERFMRAITDNSIISNYLNHMNLYAENASGGRKSEYRRILKQLEEAYGKNSFIYKYFNKSFFYISDQCNTEFYIDILIDSLDEVSMDEIEGNTWTFKCKASNISEFTIKEILNTISENGGKVNYLETKEV